MRTEINLLNNIYRFDPIFLKLNEIRDRWRNHRNRKDKRLVDNQKDVILLRLKNKFTKIPNILLNQLTEINFSCKDCFKVYLLMYKFILQRNSMYFKCKKEYLRKMTKLHRVGLDRALKELEEKRMILVDKENGYFYFAVNLSFVNWNVTDEEKENIRQNNERELNELDSKYLDDDNVFDSV